MNSIPRAYKLVLLLHCSFVQDYILHLSNFLINRNGKKQLRVILKSFFRLQVTQRLVTLAMAGKHIWPSTTGERWHNPNKVYYNTLTYLLPVPIVLCLGRFLACYIRSNKLLIPNQYSRSLDACPYRQVFRTSFWYLWTTERVVLELVITVRLPGQLEWLHTNL